MPSQYGHETKDNEEELLKNALKNYFSSSTSSSDAPQKIQIRHKSPFLYSKTSKHDARGDAMSLALENMIQRNFPLWAAHLIANDFVDAFAEKLQTNKISFTNDYQAIEANSWSRQVIECFENYIRELSQGVRDLPVMPEGWNNLPISFCAERNKKPKMEDRQIILPSLEVAAPQENKKFANNDAFFAVFDGHHGPECAAYASAHFVECLFESMDESPEITADMEKVLKDSFEKMDKRITALCQNENIKSGTTASCVYLKGTETAYLAWCGDSSIGILNNKSVETISIPHKPEDPEERKRIEEAGGMVVNINGVPRLNGVLNLSRSLGDIRAKPMVSPEPDVLAYPLAADDHILFLASDGVWDNLEEEEIFEAVKTFLADHSTKDYKLLAEFIVQKAKEAGASDNLTLICVFIKPLDEIWNKFAPT